jgi:hypothetical protein
MPDGTPTTTIISIGYDPEKGRFIGSFIGSMMTHMWRYDGTLDGDVLTLDTEGPDFSSPGKTAAYQDIVELRSDDERLLSSRVKGPDGAWHPIMTATFRRR